MRTPEFWDGVTVGSKLTAMALAPLGWAYSATVAFKAANAKPYRSSAKVICVGNLTAGGTGKTPIVIAIARALMERRLPVYILTRGYGGRVRGPTIVTSQMDASEAGDEALLLAAATPVIISPDRAAGAKLAEANSADVIVMDDGHQNFSLAKDLSIVVIDSDRGFGNGRMLPAGPLREPVQQGLARADAIILTGEGNFTPPKFTGPVLRARLVPTEGFELKGRRVLAFAGIGQPEKFFRTLRNLGAEIASAHAFPDHHVYRSHEMAQLREKSGAKNAMLITTEKDFVRLPPLQRQDVQYLSVRATFDNPNALSALLDGILQPTGGGLSD
jgi:tetraacyldisaccharide 4'-kinase